MVQGVRVCASGRYLHHAVLADYHAPVGGLGFVPAPLAPGRRRGGGAAVGVVPVRRHLRVAVSVQHLFLVIQRVARNAHKHTHSE